MNKRAEEIKDRLESIMSFRPQSWQEALIQDKNKINRHGCTGFPITEGGDGEEFVIFEVSEEHGIYKSSMLCEFLCHAPKDIQWLLDQLAKREGGHR